MKTTTGNSNRSWQRRAGLLLVTMAVLGLGGCGHMMMMLHGTGAERPPESEFGLGPRSSVNELYTATLQPASPLRPRQLQTVQVAVTDAQGRAVDGATITVDGGMPQHNHGLPTQPRVTRNLDGGMYVVEGVRFNMGGWWEFRLAISTPSGTDSVTFNLDL